MTEVALFVQFKQITCCHKGCGIVFAVPAWWEITRREDKTWWYCPNGHTQHFSGETEAEKLTREKVALQARLDRTNASVQELKSDRSRLYRRLNATRGVVTRTKNRIQHGVCPCCKRTFVALARHMATKHPDYNNGIGD